MKDNRLKWFRHVQKCGSSRLVRKIENWSQEDLNRKRIMTEDDLEDMIEKGYKRSKLTN